MSVIAEPDKPAENTKKTKEKVDGELLKSYRKRLVKLALPALGENMLISLIILVDNAAVGHLGGEAIAIAGLSGTIFFSLVMMVFAVNTGTVAVVARHTGAKEYEQARKAAGQAVVLNVCFGILITTLLMIFANRFFVLLGAEPAVVEKGALYLRILVSTFILDCAILAANAALRGSGDTKTPMKVTGIMNIVNAFLVYSLVFGAFGMPNLGVFGSCVGTALVRVIGFILGFGGLLFGWYRFRIGLKHIFPLDFDMMRRILCVAWPGLIECTCSSLARLLFIRIVAAFGTTAIAANSLLFTTEAFAIMPGLAFSVAGSIAVGHSLGEKNLDKARIMAWEAAKLAMCMMGMVTIAFIVFPFWLLRIFTTDVAVMAIGIHVLRVIALMEPIQGVAYALRGALSGAGDTRALMKISIACYWLVRLPFAYLLAIVVGWGVLGAWVALCLHIAADTLWLLRRYRSDKWTQIEV